MEIAIVGGGVSGLCAGCLLAEAGMRVSIYERKNRVGKKLLATGNGRANVSNADLSKGHWHSEGDLPFDPGAYFSAADRRAFFEAMGMDLVEEDRGKLYPSTLQARTVLNALRRRFFVAGGEEVVDTCIDAVTRTKKGFVLESGGQTFTATRKRSPRKRGRSFSPKTASAARRSWIWPVPWARERGITPSPFPCLIT